MLICPLCLKEYKKIDIQHLRKHGITKEEYLLKFPYAPYGSSEETKLKNKAVTTSRGARSEDTKNKISKSVMGKSVGRKAGVYKASPETKEKQSIAMLKHYGENKVTTEQKQKLSSILKQYYISNPKKPLEKGSALYIKRIDALNKGRTNNKQLAQEKIESIIDTITWATIVESNVKNKSSYLTIQCNACNSIISRQIQTYQKHDFDHTICHKCNPPIKGSSKAEEEIGNYLIELGLKIEVHKKLSQGTELDIFIPDKNIAIEYNGLYWHSSANKYPENKHRLKYEECLKLGIRLIQIFEDEWVFKRELVKNRLKSILNIEKSKIYARECLVEHITSKEASSFLDLYHLQGGNAKTKYNLSLKNENGIVAVMTFQKPRLAMNQKMEDGCYELVRFSSIGNIPGAFSKLISHFKKLKLPSKIYSWVDLRWADPNNNAYIKNGFVQYRESICGYAYTNLVTREHRFKFRKPKNITISEQEWNESNGYYRIYDAGTINYVLNLSNEPHTNVKLSNESIKEEIIEFVPKKDHKQLVVDRRNARFNELQEKLIDRNIHLFNPEQYVNALSVLSFECKTCHTKLNTQIGRALLHHCKEKPIKKVRTVNSRKTVNCITCGKLRNTKSKIGQCKYCYVASRYI